MVDRTSFANAASSLHRGVDSTVQAEILHELVARVLVVHGGKEVARMFATLQERS